MPLFSECANSVWLEDFKGSIKIMETEKMLKITENDNSVLVGRHRSLANLRKGGGRPKGVPNKVNKALKEMILGALVKAGGQEYLTAQAKINPKGFLALIAKILHSELKSPSKGVLIVTVSTGIER